VAYFIDEVVEQLDLSAIYDDYRDSRGQPPYQPKMMVKVLICAVIKGIHSSRKIETALYEDERIALHYRPKAKRDPREDALLARFGERAPERLVDAAKVKAAHRWKTSENPP